MSVLPQAVPAKFTAQLQASLEAAGITFDPTIKAGSRITYTITHQGRTWDVRYVLQIGGHPVWQLFGPGKEWGPTAETPDVVEAVTAAGPAPSDVPEGPLDWAVRDRDGRLWACADRVAVEETLAEAPHMTALYRVPGGQWQVLRPAEPTPAPEAPAAPAKRVPRTYLGVPVPEVVREDWDSILGAGWRLGVRSATAQLPDTRPRS